MRYKRLEIGVILAVFVGYIRYVLEDNRERITGTGTTGAETNY